MEIIVEVILNDTIVHLRQTNMVCSKCLWVPPQEYLATFFKFNFGNRIYSTQTET